MRPDPKPEPRVKKSSKVLKRARLNPMSRKRRDQIPAREECVRIVLARDGGCVFERRWAGAEMVLPMPGCWGPLDVHEPGHRSQGADPTDPDQCITLCRAHHDLVHNLPLTAKDLGL